MNETRKTADVVLRVAGATKRYGNIVALHHADFEVRRGEVMALLGENGAGKSTLVKILAGLERPDTGEILIDGKVVDLRDAARSREAGIAVVQQELSLVAPLSVAENVVLGNYPLTCSRRQMEQVARPVLEQVGLGDIDLQMPAERLSVAEQQLVEIARVLARNARVIILDEPTAALAEREIERVTSTVRRLAAAGRSIIYVTHRLAEVFDITDRVTVFRNGLSEPAVDTHSLTMDSLVERMLGRRLDQMFPEASTGFGDRVLDVAGLEGPGLSSPVDLQVRAGEILGLAGQLGSGAQAVLRLVGGTTPRAAGTIHLNGTGVETTSPIAAVRAGIAYCSDDRKRDGIFTGRSVLENLTAPGLARITRAGLLSRRRENALARELAETFRIDQRRLRSTVDTLSGGNQQKVALGKWLGIQPRVLLIDEPSRGVDVGARAEIYTHLRNLAEQGLAVVFASSSLQEVLGLSDTVVSFYHGRPVAQSRADELSEDQLFRQVTHPALPEQPGRAASDTGETSVR